MDEFQLQAWERELNAWRRKLDHGGAPPALSAEISAAADEIDLVRLRLAANIAVSGERVARHFTRLRALWDLLGEAEHAGMNQPA
jgi:hypothetical protein